MSTISRTGVRLDSLKTLFSKGFTRSCAKVGQHFPAAVTAGGQGGEMQSATYRY